MRKIYFLLMALFLAFGGWSQTTTWTGAVNTNWDNAGNWDNGVPAANYIVIFPAGSAGNITRVAQGGDITLSGLLVQGNATVRLVNTVARTITIANGAAFNDFAVAAPAQLTIGTNINITLAAGTGGNPTAAGIDGDFIIEAARTYDSDNSNVITNVDGIIRNIGTVLGGATKLSFNGGSLYVHAQNDGVIPTATWNATSTMSVEGTINTGPTGLNQTFGNFTWNSPLQAINYNFDGAVATINGDFTVTSTGTGSIILKNLTGGGGTTTTVNGDYIQTGGILSIVGSTATYNLSLKGDFNMSGGTFRRTGSSGTATVLFSGTAEQAFTKTGGAIAGAVNFTINSNAKVNFGTSVLSGSTGTFTLSNGGRIITANINGLGPAGSIQMPTISFNSLADYEFRGPSTGVFTTTSGNSVRDLIVNNTDVDGEVLLAMPITVTRTLVLTAGLLTTSNTNLLLLGTAATATPPSVTSFVNGPMAKTGTTAFTFPVGKAGAGYRTIATSATSGAQTFRAEFFRSNPAGGTLTGGLTQISNCEFWDLTRIGGGAGITAQVTLSWEPSSPCGSSPAYVTNPATLVVAHLVGGNWLNEGNSGTTGNTTAGTVTSANAISTFSPFALGSISAVDNPLPVLFANVKAYEKNGGVQIDWSNMTEKDVAGYTVERSGNGQDFSSVSEQSPTSNQNDRADYSAFDANPPQGNNYYRIKAEETTGKIVYSKILNVNVGSTTESLRLYPNPVIGNQITVSMSNIKRGKYTLRVISTSGQEIFRQVINNQSSNLTQTLDLPGTIKGGVYNLVIQGDGYRQIKTFVVQ